MNFEIKKSFSVSAETIYNAWLDSTEHAAMTGGAANCSKQEGEKFSAWDGYITGKNIQLIPNSTIIQSWRTADFADDQVDSQIKISLEDTNKGCTLILTHTNIPDGQPDYKKGWNEHYSEPMEDYFKNK